MSSLIERVVVFDREEMARRGRLGAAARHSRHDPRETARAAHLAFLRTFEDAVDPARALPEAERRQRADTALRTHMRRLAAASATARRERAGTGRQAVQA